MSNTNVVKEEWVVQAHKWPDCWYSMLSFDSLVGAQRATKPENGWSRHPEITRIVHRVTTEQVVA